MAFTQEQDAYLASVNKVSSIQHNEIIHAYVLNDVNLNIVTVDTLFYAWFKSGKINFTQGFFNGRLLHGTYTSYDEQTMSLKQNGMYSYGLKSKVWKEWYKNGKLKRKENYVNGIRHGEYREWSENGILMLEGTYKKGLRNGTFIFLFNGAKCSLNYKNGVLLHSSKDLSEPNIKMKVDDTLQAEKIIGTNTRIHIKEINAKVVSDTMKKNRMDIYNNGVVLDTNIGVNIKHNKDTIQHSIKKNNAVKFKRNNINKIL